MSLPQSPEELRGMCVDEIGMKLLKAADCKRVEPGYCAITVISEACGGQNNPAFDPAWERFKAIHRFADNNAVYQWHDAPERTADEVIAALTQAAFASVP